MLQRVCAVLFLIGALSAVPATAQEGAEVQTPPIVDINSAPVEEIESIVLDDLLAMRIIEGRPYANKRQLLSRRLVSEEEYERIKDRIVARRMVPQ